jgi:hypothetical protein
LIDMLTIITLQNGETKVELVAENSFEQRSIDDFDFNVHELSLSKDDKQLNQSVYDKDRKLVLVLKRKTENSIQ